jgi:hypothetical protein
VDVGCEVDALEKTGHDYRCGVESLIDGRAAAGIRRVRRER